MEVALTEDMRIIRPSWAWLAAALVVPAFMATAGSGVGSVDDLVTVRDVVVRPTTISGTIANVSDDRLTGIDLMISDRFLWEDEFSPGSDDPSRGYVESLDLVIAPHTSVPFRIDRRPLPDRDDGRFVTEVAPIRVQIRDVVAPPVVPRADAARPASATRP